MIIVELDRQTFQYDVHSLVKAFYPAEDVKMVEETPADGEALLRLVVSFVMPDAGNGDMEIRPDDPYSEEGLGIGTTVRVRIYEPTEELKTEESVILQTDERKEIKNELKRLLYRVLSAHTNQQLPMGEPDRNQADKDSNGTSGAGMEKPGYCQLYAKHLLYKQ